MKKTFYEIFKFRNISFVTIGSIVGLFAEEPAPSMVYFPDCECHPVTPEAGPHVVDGFDLFVTADFIYWTVRQDGMFHAVSGIGANAPKGKVSDLDWEWDAGFKVGLGYNLPHDGWDLYAEYTRITSSASDTTSQDPIAPSLFSYWSINGAPLTQITQSKANWKICFNDLFLELGRNSYLSQYLKLKIHAGLRGSIIDQSYSVTQPLTNGSIDQLNLGQDFWGIGITAGLDTAWQFNHSFSFYADLAMSILWGQFDLDRRDQNIVNGIPTTNIHTRVSPHTFEPVLNLGTGLRWDTWFCDCQYHASISAGWEHQLWILQNELIKVPTETDHIGDLVLQGLTIQIRFDF